MIASVVEGRRRQVGTHDGDVAAEPERGIDTLPPGRRTFPAGLTVAERRARKLALAVSGCKAWRRVTMLEDRQGEFSYRDDQSRDGRVHHYTWRREKIKRRHRSATIQK
ncbi:MAG: hypothetical protein Udaeo2_22860 [Candidatus Udaeobacter sp.]|nr:MAG: hypothetical protein Udaeo2_22860 [Candidatus Udaeobacter sp.]